MVRAQHHDNRMSDRERTPRVWLKTALLFFGVWLLASALLFEHTAFARFVFEHQATMWLYLALQGLVHLAALVACIMTIVKGPTLHRLIALVPALLLVAYGLVAIGGPG
jgi:hypothetical protein